MTDDASKYLSETGIFQENRVNVIPYVTRSLAPIVLIMQDNWIHIFYLIESECTYIYIYASVK